MQDMGRPLPYLLGEAPHALATPEKKRARGPTEHDDTKFLAIRPRTAELRAENAAGTVIGRRSTKGPDRPVIESRRAREKRWMSRERYFLLAAGRSSCLLNSDRAGGLATCATASDTIRSSGSAANKRRAVRHASGGPSGMQNV